MRSSRVHLSIGPSGTVRAIGTVLALVFIGASVVFIAVALGMGSVADSWGDWFSDPGFAGYPAMEPEPMPEPFSLFSLIAKAMALCGVPFVLAGLYGLLYVWRSAAWLDGTVVSRRGALLTRSVDLAAAEVSMGGVTYAHGRYHHRVAALAVTDAASGRTMKVPLRGQGLDLLPPSQLLALADALGRNPADRARAIGEHLRALAQDPLAA